MTPAHERDLQRLEVRRVDHCHVEQRQLALVRLGTRRERDGRLPLAADRQVRTERCALHARNRAHLRQQLVQRHARPLDARILAWRQTHHGGEHVRRLEAGVHGREPGEAPHQQARPRQQHDGERHLGHGQRGPCPLQRRATARTAAAFLQRGHQLRASRLQRRRETEEQSGEQRHAQREQQHRRVHVSVRDARRAPLQRHQEPHARHGDPHAQRAPGERQHHALRQNLPHDVPARRAERRAQRELPLPRRGARQHEARHVGARDQQHQRHGGHQDLERRLDEPHHPVHQRRARRAEARVLAGIFRAQLRVHALEIRHRLLHRDVGLETSHGEQVWLPPAVVGGVRREQPHREDHVRVLVARAIRHAHVRREHAHHRVRLAVEHQRAAEHRAVAAEARLEEAVVQQRDARRARRVIRRRHEPAQRRPHAEELEIVAAHQRSVHALGVAPARHGERRPRVVDPDVLEPALPLSPVLEVGIRDERPVAARPRLPQHHQPVRLAVGQGREHHAVDDAEDRGVGADAERQGDHRDGGECRLPAQRAQGKA